MTAPHLYIFGIYHSPKVPVSQLYQALSDLLICQSSQLIIFISDFNVNWLNNTERMSLFSLFIRDRKYNQLVS